MKTTMHFGVYRWGRNPSRRSTEKFRRTLRKDAQRKLASVLGCVPLCGGPHLGVVEGFLDCSATWWDAGRGLRHPKTEPCTRCLLLFNFALANRLPIRHQFLDLKVAELLARQSEGQEAQGEHHQAAATGNLRLH